MLQHQPQPAHDCNHNEVVRLNVGGVTFQTTRTTLRASALEPHSFLSRIIQYNSAHRNAAGCFFIDRCGERFRTVLNYLRTGAIHCTNDAAQLRALAEEAEFYCMDRLAAIVRRELDRIALEEQMAAMRNECNCSAKRTAVICKNIDFSTPASPVDVKITANNRLDCEFRLDVDF